MKCWLYVHRTIDAPGPQIEQLLPQLRPLLQAATTSDPTPPDGDGSFLLAVPGPTLGREIGKQVRMHTGPARRSGHRIVLPLGWRAAPASALFPVFEGSLEVEPLDSRRSQLTLVGTTTPPLGPFGRALDSTVFHAIAERTAARLLDALCQEFQQAIGSDPLLAQPVGRVRLEVADVMTRDPLVVDEDTSVRTAAVLLHHGGITGLPVIDADGTLVGVLSESDLLAHIAPERAWLGRKAARERHRREASTAGAACTRPARCTAPDAPITAAAREMLDHDVSRLVVLDGGNIVGIVTRHDLLAVLLRNDESLLRAVDSIIRAEDSPDVSGEVTSGSVELQGEVALRSDVERLHDLMTAIDGVEQVDTAGLRWRVDDLLAVETLPFT